ncbi:MAG: dephospho-CoA kinase [Magnetococcus sp. WYHC-3]
MFILGLTGSLGSGKTTVAGLLKDKGARVLDSDQLARDAVEPETPGYELVVARFGPGVLLGSGVLDRRALAQRVFGDPQALADLEAIIHPQVRQLQRSTLETWAAETPQAVVVMMIPLLFETGAERRCDEVAVVVCGEHWRQRIGQRPMSLEAMEKARERQMDELEKARRANWVIENTGTLDATRTQIDRLWGALTHRPGRAWPDAW